jgi:hypothetical protein
MIRRYIEVPCVIPQQILSVSIFGLLAKIGGDDSVHRLFQKFLK